MDIMKISPCEVYPLKPVKMRFEGGIKKSNNACNYVIQKFSMLFFSNIDPIII